MATSRMRAEKPQIDIVAADAAAGLEGPVVVIDVLRAFTTAAYAFAAGVSEIWLAETIEEAFALAERDPSALLMGESGGYPIEGFDFGNSPSEIIEQSIAGRRLIQRTTAGTRAAVAASGADPLLVGSFVCAAATVRQLERRNASRVALVLSGRRGKWDGNDDAACAELLAARLAGGGAIDPAPFLEDCRRSHGSAKFLDPAKPAFPASDLELALEVDRFDFAMIAARRDDLLVVTPAPATD